MNALMPQRSLYHGLRDFPVRKVAGVLALLVATTILGFRLRYLDSLNRIELSSRAEKFAIVKKLHDRVLTYSEQYGRPIFVLTGVRHLSPAESTVYKRLLVDLLDARVRYWYDDESFAVGWYEPRQSYRPDRNQIVLQHPWPAPAALYARTRWIAYQPPPLKGYR